MSTAASDDASARPSSKGERTRQRILDVALAMFYDASEGQEQSRELARRTAPLVARVVALSRLKVLRPLVKQGEELVRDFLITRRPRH